MSFLSAAARQAEGRFVQPERAATKSPEQKSERRLRDNDSITLFKARIVRPKDWLLDNEAETQTDG